MPTRADLPPLDELLAKYRAPLKRAVLVRMDPLLAARLDASDVVQDAFAEASRRWQSFLNSEGHDAIEFYPWLRDIALRRLTDLYRRHVLAKRRTVRREERGPPLSDASFVRLSERLVAPNSSPSRRLDRKERMHRVRAALESLPAEDREVLVLKYLEELPTTEIASILGITDRSVRYRHRKALERIAEQLTDL
jgi:RNA polymerase sigma-70 factor (ECF subfamily)